MKCSQCQFENPDDTLYCGKCGSKLPAAEDISVSQTKTFQTAAKELTKGTTFAGRYKLIKELGRGGMGVVYKAQDTKLKRTVALKFLPPELTHISEVKERFMREAQAAAALDHPNICTVHEIDEAEGKIFISMTYVEGQSLKEKIEKGPLKLNEALGIALQVAEGLEEAHKKGVVHRDIKSANIMVTGKGQANIMDFGLAKIAGKTMITKEGTSMGTIAYMSPEQAQGETVDHRTDIWSFGVMLYEMVTGQVPFKGDYEQAVVYSILNDDQEPMTSLRTGVPMELERIVNKAMAKNPEERYQHVDEMLVDLRSVAKELETSVTKTRLAPAARPETTVSFFKDLLRRRVPQILGIYLVGHFVIIMFIEWLMHSYPLSPHLPYFFIIALASIIPTIILLAYFHGRTGRYPWGKIEKIGIPVNLLVSAVLLFVLFQGKDLGAATTTVTYTDEEGQMIERVIPKSEFRKKAALFFFDNETGDSTLNWLQYGIPDMVGYDLSQDIYLQIESGYIFYEKIKEAGFPQAVQVPLTLKKKIADDLHIGYFISGSLAGQSGQFLVKISLHDTKTGKSIAKNSFSSSGKDIFTLVDDISIQLKHDLEIPAYHIDKTEDLPVAEILSNSIPALKAYYSAFNTLVFDDDWKDSIKLIEQAIKEDPTFAFAYYNLQILYGLSNQGAKRAQAFQPLMQHLYKLPERIRFAVKHDYYYLIKQDPDKAFAVVEMWTELYPEDIAGHTVLAVLYELRNQLDEAISVYKHILELNPEQYDVLRTIGSLYKLAGEFEEALKYYQQYADKFPKDARSFTSIAGLYKTLGDYEKAKSFYEKALLIEPDKISILLTLAAVESDLGNFKQALEQYQDVLKISKTPKDRVEVYNSLVSFHELRGQMSKSLEYIDLKVAEMGKFQPLLLVLFDRIETLDKYIKAGKIDVAFQTIKAIEEQITPPYDKFMSFGILAVYLELEDADNAEKAIEGAEAAIQAFQLEVARTFIHEAQGKIHEMRNEYEQAIQSYQKQLELEPTALTVNEDIGRCYRKLKNFKKADEYLQKTLKIYPFRPNTNYEMALVYYDMGKKEKALEHLKKALYVWEEADPEYTPAKKAREKLAEWESSNS
jgi:tetratricopeptide (TPR) repeat protein/predicted Ser/Thr protein kinase